MGAGSPAPSKEVAVEVTLAPVEAGSPAPSAERAEGGPAKRVADRSRSRSRVPTPPMRKRKVVRLGDKTVERAVIVIDPSDL